MGPMKLLRHKDNDRIRLLMRQDKTLKIRANHIGVQMAHRMSINLMVAGFEDCANASVWLPLIVCFVA